MLQRKTLGPERLRDLPQVRRQGMAGLGLGITIVSGSKAHLPTTLQKRKTPDKNHPTNKAQMQMYCLKFFLFLGPSEQGFALPSVRLEW